MYCDFETVTTSRSLHCVLCHHFCLLFRFKFGKGNCQNKLWILPWKTCQCGLFHTRHACACWYGHCETMEKITTCLWAKEGTRKLLLKFFQLSRNLLQAAWRGGSWKKSKLCMWKLTSKQKSCTNPLGWYKRESVICNFLQSVDVTGANSLTAKMSYYEFFWKEINFLLNVYNPDVLKEFWAG